MYGYRKSLKIEQTNDNLQAQVKTIYDYWFSQFDFPDEDGRPYKSSGGKMVYNSELKYEIPDGWKVVKLSNLCNIVLGGTPSTDVSEYWNGNINWLNSGEVSQFPVVKSELKISDLGLNNSPAKLMPIGTTIVSITGNIRVSILSIEACANQSVVGILESSEIKKEYIYQNILRLLNRFTTISTGNCQQHINKGSIEDALIILPKQDVLMSYYSVVHPFYRQISEVSIENQKLTELRDWLLPMLMNGQATIVD